MSLFVHLRVVILHAIAIILPIRVKEQAMNVSAIAVALYSMIIAKSLCSTAASEIARYVEIEMWSSIA